MSRKLHSRTLAALLLAALAGVAPAADDCGLPCLEMHSSVVNAAGTDPKIRQAIEALRFEGDGLAASSKAEVKQLATAWLRRTEVLALSVRAERGATGPRAQAQAEARATALQRELVAAGLPAARVRISAAK